MLAIIPPRLAQLHRRTGGLEMAQNQQLLQSLLHRRTGGLEITTLRKFPIWFLHRRTGGLEIKCEN